MTNSEGVGGNGDADPSARPAGSTEPTESTESTEPTEPTESTEPTEPQLQAAASTFFLLSSPVRLHLVWLAAHHEHDVGTLARLAGVTVASASQHLSKLRLAGVVSTRNVGRRHLYTVEDPHIRALLDQIIEHIAPDGTLAPDPETARPPAPR